MHRSRILLALAFLAASTAAASAAALPLLLAPQRPGEPVAAAGPGAGLLQDVPQGEGVRRHLHLAQRHLSRRPRLCLQRVRRAGRAV